MTRMKLFHLRHLILAVAAIAAAIAALDGAQAAGVIEKGVYLSGPRYEGDVPPCEAMLDTISSQFAKKESTFWNSALAITGFDRVREVAFRPWTNESIPRRFCEARAMISDGKPRLVRYGIIEDGGFASYGAGVVWCVVGLDRNWAYQPACRAARP